MASKTRWILTHTSSLHIPLELNIFLTLCLLVIPQGVVGAKHISDSFSNARMIPYFYHQSFTEASKDAPHFTAVQLG